MSEMERWKEEFLNLKTIAVVGATDRVEKWGYKIFKRLRDEGYEAIPIHPRLKELEGVKCYPSLLEAPSSIEGVDVVIPPARVMEVLKQCVEKGISYVWLQPGTESEEALRFGEEQGLKLIHHDCVLQALNRRQGGKT